MSLVRSIFSAKTYFFLEAVDLEPDFLSGAFFSAGWLEALPPAFFFEVVFWSDWAAVFLAGFFTTGGGNRRHSWSARYWLFFWAVVSV